MTGIIIRKPRKIGYLEYEYEGKRDGNIGGELMYRLASAHGIVERVRVDAINNVDILLVSIPSTSQVIDLYKLFLDARVDKQRKCKIVVGGFGCQNINIILPFIDAACFGRMHDVLGDIIDGVMSDDVPESVADHMFLTKRVTPVSFRQAPLYTGDGFSEEFTGCPLKCKFCHYTYARKKQGGGSSYVQSLLTSGGADEILYQDLLKQTDKIGRVRTAIDGFSERIRYLYGKRISNQLIIDGINHVGEIGRDKLQNDMFGGGDLNRKTVMTVYNICNFPCETSGDEAEFAETVSQANPSSRVLFILHSTPFRASPATPMQWERVQIWPDWSAMREKVIVDRPNLLVKYSYTLEGPWSQLMAAMVERASADDSALINNALKFGKSMRAADRASRFMDAYDVSRHIGEHDIEGPPPGAWYLTSYLGDEKLRKIARKMREQRTGWVN